MNLLKLDLTDQYSILEGFVEHPENPKCMKYFKELLVEQENVRMSENRDVLVWEAPAS